MVLMIILIALLVGSAIAVPAAYARVAITRSAVEAAEASSRYWDNHWRIIREVVDIKFALRKMSSIKRTKRPRDFNADWRQLKLKRKRLLASLEAAQAAQDAAKAA